MRAELLRTLVLGIALGIVGCGSQQNSTPLNTGSGGSTAATGGSNASASGGKGAGGTTTSSGVATGGSNATTSFGGNGSGGAATGGTNATTPSGGGSGGGGTTSVATGGTKATGGGGAGSGGTTTSSGVAAGGTKATGGSGPGSGGSGGAGGTANGGTSGTADASTGDTASQNCTPGAHTTTGKQYCSPPSNGSAGGNYTYDLWSDGNGTGCLTVYGVDATFKANWTNVGDWIARVGLAFDKTKTYSQIGTFSCDFSYTLTGVTSGGFGNIGIYGWSVNPLHEYYIAENWLGKKPNFTKVGTFTIDGEGTYDVMTNQQKNAPNITGTNQDFVQFWSVNQTPRQCGHISISKHFDQWATLGLQLGNLEETRILIEGQNNSGTIDFTTATVVTK